MRAAVQKLLELGRGQRREWQPKKTFEWCLFDNLDRAVKADFSNRKADAWNCAHGRVRLSIGRLHKHYLLMFHRSSKSFPYVPSNDNNFTATVDDSRNHNCTIQGDLNRPKWQCRFGRKLFVIDIHRIA